MAINEKVRTTKQVVLSLVRLSNTLLQTAKDVSAGVISVEEGDKFAQRIKDAINGFDNG